MKPSKTCAHTQSGGYGYVVEADITGFFDNIDHQWMMMLEQMIDDTPFLRLIKKWLKAGILRKMAKSCIRQRAPHKGVSCRQSWPMYLHYALDLWFEKVVKKASKGAIALYRYMLMILSAWRNTKKMRKFLPSPSQRLGRFNSTWRWKRRAW